MTRILITDYECENHTYFSRVASQFCPDNWIVMSGYRVDEVVDGKRTTGEVKGVRYNSREEFLRADINEWLPLQGVDIIVAHNACYELLWILSYAKKEFEEFIKLGGKVWCTQKAEYLLSNYTDYYPRLDEVAVKYGGTHKVDGVKILWETGVLTSNIDPDLLSEYLLSDSGDIVNTAKVFYGQLAKCVERGQLELAWIKMDAVLAFAYCEFHGMFVNMPIAIKQKEQLEKDIEKIKAELNSYIPKDLPFEFNWGSRHHVSALMFGGSIKYKAMVSYEPKKYDKVDCYQLVEEYGQFNKGVYVAIDEAEYNRIPDSYLVKYKAGKFKGNLKVTKQDSTIEKMKIGEGYYNFKGIVNIKKLPQHIRKEFMGKGGFVGAQVLSDNTPVYSTSGEVLDILAAIGYDFCKKLKDMATKNKDLGTYYLKVDDKGKETGMLKYVSPTKEDGSGIVHHQLNTCASKTGRLTANNPNMQNIPRDGTSEVKRMFTSRYGEQGRITECDYSALEVVKGCVISKDRILADLLMKDTDLHCYRLAGKHHMLYEVVYEYCHNKELPQYKEWHERRTKIKSPSFAWQYGATPEGIAYATGLTIEEAKEFCELQERLFPDTVKFRETVRKQVEGNPYVYKALQMEDGSIRMAKVSYFLAPSTTRYSYSQKVQGSKDEDGKYTQILDFKNTELANYWNQGEAFLMMEVAAGLTVREFIKRSWFDGKSLLINNVHDALYLDSYDEVIGKEASLLLKKCMEDAKWRMLEVFPMYRTDTILEEIPFPAAIEMGVSMYDKKTIED